MATGAEQGDEALAIGIVGGSIAGCLMALERPELPHLPLEDMAFVGRDPSGAGPGRRRGPLEAALSRKHRPRNALQGGCDVVSRVCPGVPIWTTPKPPVGGELRKLGEFGRSARMLGPARTSRNPWFVRDSWTFAVGAELEGERRDLNPRPPGPQPGALPTELRPPRATNISGGERLSPALERQPLRSSSSMPWTRSSSPVGRLT
jgi:hypothetical protein